MNHLGLGWRVLQYVQVNGVFTVTLSGLRPPQILYVMWSSQPFYLSTRETFVPEEPAALSGAVSRMCSFAALPPTNTAFDGAPIQARGTGVRVYPTVPGSQCHRTSKIIYDHVIVSSKVCAIQHVLLKSLLEMWIGRTKAVVEKIGDANNGGFGRKCYHMVHSTTAPDVFVVSPFVLVPLEMLIWNLSVSCGQETTHPCSRLDRLQ